MEIEATESVVDKLLVNYGFRRDMVGFDYLKYAVMLCVNDEVKYKKNFITALLPEVKQYVGSDITPQGVFDSIKRLKQNNTKNTKCKEMTPKALIFFFVTKVKRLCTTKKLSQD